MYILASKQANLKPVQLYTGKNLPQGLYEVFYPHKKRTFGKTFVYAYPITTQGRKVNINISKMISIPLKDLTELEDSRLIQSITQSGKNKTPLSKNKTKSLNRILNN